MDKNTELLEVINHGLWRQKRRIYWGTWGDLIDPSEAADEAPGDVTWASVEMVIRALHILVADNDKAPIELHVQSHGGDTYSMLRLVDEIEACPCAIKFFGGGIIASCMSWIMCVCDERYLHKNSYVMVHDGNNTVYGTHTNINIDVAQECGIQDRLDKLFADNSRMPVEFWRDILQRDLYLTAEEAVKLGIADDIIEPKKRGNLRRHRINRLNRKVDIVEMQVLIKNIYNRIKRRTLPKIELAAPKKEQFDPNIRVEEQESSVEPAASTDAAKDDGKK